MKKILPTLASFFLAWLLYVSLTANKLPDNKKYYYAFNEKIYLDDVPDKYLIKFKDKLSAKKYTAAIQSELVDSFGAVLQDEITATISLKNYKKGIANLLKDKMANIEILKPAYKYQGQIMYYGDEILVEPKDGISINEVLRITGFDKVAKIKKTNFFSVIEIANTEDACDIANIIQESGLVKYSYPNFRTKIIKTQFIPNDTYFNNQFYLLNTGQTFNPVENHAGTFGSDINATWAWTRTTGNSAITVAVIDEGLTPDHPDLPNSRQLRLNGSNFADGDPNDPSASASYHANHGNACAGIIAASQNNSEGVSGIAPNVNIMPVRILRGNFNNDYYIQSMSSIASAIDFAWQNGAQVISNSWGFSTSNPYYDPAIVNAISRATYYGRNGLGSVVVFAAGNYATRYYNGDNGYIGFPANVPINGVLTVGASDRDDHLADYSPLSNSGSSNNQIIDIVAPSNKAFPSSLMGIPGESSEIWSIDLPGTDGWNQWNDPSYPIAPVGQISPSSGNNYLYYTQRMGGTSAACPQVAAAAALILSLNNNLTQQQVFDIITQSAEKVGGYSYNGSGWSNEFGYGRLNLYAAINGIPNTFPVLGSDIICTNGSASYSVSGLPSGSSTIWSSSNTNVATISSGGIASWTGSGTVTFTATSTIPNRGGTAISQKTVTVGDAIFSSNAISGDNALCGNSNPYTITNLPGGASVNWNASPGGIVTINTPYSSQTTLSSQSSGTISLSATISYNGCSITIYKNNISVTNPSVAGTKSYTTNYGSSYTSGIESQYAVLGTYHGQPGDNDATFNYTINDPSYSGFTWTPVSVPSGTSYQVVNNGLTLWTYVTNPYSNGSVTITMRLQATGPCGLITKDISSTAARYGGYGGYSVSIFPNPATSELNVSLLPQKQSIAPTVNSSKIVTAPTKSLIYIIKIVDNLGVVRKTIQYKNGISNIKIPVNDIPHGNYKLSFFDGREWNSQNIIIQ